MLDVTQTRIQEGVIDLGVGHPGLELLPLNEMLQAAQHRLSQPDSTLLQYGAELGDGYFRQALAGFLSKHYGLPVPAEQLLITSGVSQALDLVCTAFTKPGDVIFVEEPSYFLAFGIFRDHHLKVVGIPTDVHGLRVEDLETALARHKPRLIYTIPSFQNPTGTTLSLERRRQLVELSQHHGFLVVADEVYQLLSYGEAPPPPLGGFSDSGTVLSLGSFSKILAPGLRLGWVQAAPELLDRLVQNGVIASGGGLNPFTSAIVHSAIELGLQETHLQKLKTIYQKRLAALLGAIETHWPGLSYLKPSGGYFVWLDFPHLGTQDLLTKAIQAGVRFQPGIKFSSTNSQQNALRLCFAYYDSAKLEEGVKRLAAILAVS